MSCIFCALSASIAQNRHAYAVYDLFPVNPGHVLIIPMRHVEDYFQLTAEEEADLWSLLREVKAMVEAERRPDGWNIGINNGKAAGQTIFHLHIHLIPRYEGDMEKPEGGVRGVIPGRQKYSRPVDSANRASASVTQPPVLTTQRLTLRPLALADAERVHQYRSDPEIMRYQGFRPAKLEETKAFILHNTAVFNTEGRWFQYGICLDNQVIGDIGIHFMAPHNTQCGIGYTLDSPQQGKGYGQEAVSAVVGYLFCQLKKHRITAEVDPGNIPSIRLLERIGFKKEAHFLKCYFCSGVWKDELVFALREEEWRDR